LRADLPDYRPSLVEQFFAAHGFAMRRVDTLWRFENRDVLGIEFSAEVAHRAFATTPGTSVEVAYRVHWRRKTLTSRR